MNKIIKLSVCTCSIFLIQLTTSLLASDLTQSFARRLLLTEYEASANLPSIRSITSTDQALYALRPLGNELVIIRFKQKKFDKIVLYGLKDITFIHAITDAQLLLMSGDTIQYQAFDEKGQPLKVQTFKKSEFGLAKEDELLSVAGDALSLLWITYKKADDSLKTRLWAIEAENKLVVDAQERDYKSVTIYDKSNAMWFLLQNNGIVIEAAEVDGKEDEEIDFAIYPEKEKEFLKSTISLNTIYAYTKEVVYGLNESGSLYVWNNEKKDFLKVIMPNEVFLDGYKYIAFSDGFIYMLNKNGKIYIIAAQNLQKEENKALPKSPLPIRDTDTPNLESIEINNEHQGDVQGESTKTLGQDQKSGKLVGGNKSNLASMLQKLPPQQQKTFMRGMKFAQPFSTPEKSQETISTNNPAASVEWRAINQERNDPSYESGFNVGFMQGIMLNKAYPEILQELKAPYDKGLAEGAKGCVLDSVLWQIIEIFKQESFKALSGAIQLF